MKKVLEIILLLSLIAVLCFVTYEKYIKYDFCLYKVDNNLMVKVILDASDGYKLDSDNFKISKEYDDKTIYSTGEFITKDYYDYLINNILNDNAIRIISEETKENLDFIFYVKNESEYIHLIKIKDTDITFVLRNEFSLEDSVKIFRRLDFKIV